MDSAHIFISHASMDDNFVKELRTALESQRLPVWVDSRNLRGGAKLAPEIEQAIETARQTIVVLSPKTINSPWVRKEIQQALAVEKRRGKDGYRVIPLLLPGVEPSALALWFDEEPVGVKVEFKVGSVNEALPQILVALGERLPTDYQPPEPLPQKPVEELIVEMSDPEVETIDGKRRVSATATLVYQPADAAARAVESKRFRFTAPLGPIETDDLRWYLEEFFRWPVGVFKERADAIAARLPGWGKLLFDEAAKTDSAKETLKAWRNAADNAEQRFSVMVDSELSEGASAEDQAAAKEAASMLLSLPWELLHDGRGFLFHGKNPVRVRRRLPNRNPQKSVTRELPIRILLVSPRPEEKGVAYLDHRVSAKPLVEAVESLGELAKLTILSPPTFATLQTELKRAADAGQPYDVVHFDGHGVYDRKVGLGGLCFEDPKDADKLEDRAMRLVYAKELAEVMRDHRIPLVFLEACQSAQTEENPSASLAASLLSEGVTSVVAMSHSVLVETAHRFVRAFYGELARGARIGTAMLAGQLALQTDSYRGRIMGAGDLRLQDWFVPVLYQETQDPRP
jgi:CHAT domain-containing protein